jgi:hypothetical protein
MDSASASFYTTDYSLYPDSFNNSDTYASTTENNSSNDSYLSVGSYSSHGRYYPLTITFWWQDRFTIEIDFDQGVPLPFSETPTSYICGESLTTLGSIGSFDLRDTTVLYPIPTDQHQRSLSKAVQAEDYPELKYFYKLLQYRTQKCNNPYKFYGFWNTYVQQVYRVPGGLQLLSKLSDRIDLPTHAYRKVLWETWNPQNYYEPKEPQFFNCYGVRPIRKGSFAR